MDHINQQAATTATVQFVDSDTILLKKKEGDIEGVETGDTVTLVVTNEQKI